MSASTNHLLHPKYRPDIDGLRAIAVLSVLIFHAFPEWLSGGFVGVDIFFVISGYLISTIIFENLAQQRFSYKEFYVRRINRIFPALFFVLIASYAFGWLNLLADDFAQLGKHIAGGAGFVSNLVLWNESGYFDKAAEVKPLLHLWSLGIEEQFYIFWPLFICWISRWPKKVLPAILLITVVSFVLNVTFISSNPVATFYSPITRFWELLFGSLLAYWTLHSQAVNRVTSAQKNIASVLGLGLIILGIFALNQKSLFPGWWALLPTIGAILLIAAGPGAWCNRHILSLRVMVWIGLISFPLYLWHWPLLALARVQEGGTLPLFNRAILVLVAIALSWLTYQFVEKPIRFNTRFRTQKNVALVILMILVGYLGYNCFDRKGIEFRHKFFIKQISSYTFDKVAEQRQRTCFLMDKGDDVTNFSKVCIHDDRPFKLVLWGDSHGGSIYPGFSELERQNVKVGVTQFTAAGCGGLLPTDEQGSFCQNANELALKEIFRIKPNLVVIYKAWHPHYLPLLKATLEKLHAANIAVLVIGPTPRWTDDLPRMVYRYWKNHKELPPKYSFEGVAQNLLVMKINDLNGLRKAFKEQGLLFPKALEQFNLKNGIKESEKAFQSLNQAKFGYYYSASAQMCNEDGCFIPMKVLDADLKKLVIAHGGDYYSAYDRLCNERGCLNRMPGAENALTTLDEDHITPAAARYIVKGLNHDFLNALVK
ncbi:acyltransferase family protein [Polynucleobacter sp. UB-Siik-W21]|uniref:acyltransferase family protein n=1 Tax=Polynucleobacter sp. UB-Siik-W21 TaxID=1855646 RepID=UPI00203C705A|nr:acyltransferase family protein [Polynucleobacter sp. UB-Siik-W21]QWD70684.1 acyltransferase family protein [Polynucleobacter sp. UB-Siik-W21]